MVTNSKQSQERNQRKKLQVYLKLKEEEAEFIAGELHHLIDQINNNKEKKEKALRIGNKIAEQLLEQRNLKDPVRGKREYGRKKKKRVKI